jgi:spore maturation protein CgeB
MTAALDIAFFGSSLVSAYWNGAATYYRGIVRALHERGHRVTFYEPDAYGRQQHRDIDDPTWARVVVYAGEGEAGVLRALDQARGADLIVKASGVGVFDDLLEREVLALRAPSTLVAFWDVDAPATLDRVMRNPADAFRVHVPRYDVVFTYGGGDPVVRAYEALGARRCVPIYNALDPSTHHPAPPEPRFECDLGFLGNRLPDREARVEEFFLRPAARLPARRFLLGGNGWIDKAMPPNVTALGHVYTHEHNAFNSTARAVLNVNRESMARYGFSPPTRVFEAAGAAACLITDAWEGIELFLEPDREVLVAANGDEVAAHLAALTPERARAFGEAAHERVLAEHTYAHRALEVERVLDALPSRPAPRAPHPASEPARSSPHAPSPAA